MWLPIQGHWNSEKRKVHLIGPDSSQYYDGPQREPPTTVVRANNEVTCSPTTLAISDAFSVSASCMKFHEYSRAQVVPFVNADNIERVWQSTIAFLAQSVFASQHVSYFAISARVITIGCFVERVTSSQFSIGIITQTHEDVSTPGNAASQELAAWFSSSLEGIVRSSSDILPNVEVPVCRGFRQVRMTVRGEVGAQQVAVGHVIPPIHVVCHFDRHSLPSVALAAISCVKVFLLRPQESKLQGHCVQLVGNVAAATNADQFLPPLRSLSVPSQHHHNSHQGGGRGHFVFEHIFCFSARRNTHWRGVLHQGGVPSFCCPAATMDPSILGASLKTNGSIDFHHNFVFI